MFDRKPVRYKCVKHFPSDCDSRNILCIFIGALRSVYVPLLFVNNHFFVVVMVFNVLKIFVHHPHHGMKLDHIKYRSRLQRLRNNPCPPTEVGQPAYNTIRSKNNIESLGYMLRYIINVATNKLSRIFASFESCCAVLLFRQRGRCL